METNQEWTQTKGRKKGGNKAPNLTLNIIEATGGSSSQKRMVKSPAEATNTETDGGKTKGKKAAQKKPVKQDTGIKNMPPLVVDKIFTFGQGIRKELERKLEKDFNVKFNDNSTTIRTSTEKDYQTMIRLESANESKASLKDLGKRLSNRLAVIEVQGKSRKKPKSSSTSYSKDSQEVNHLLDM
ncbi:hypothetical protein JTB14_026232 [Gonioctena quinquepunctata]|nr:hypothetical protein JTB14_026232 [Gonioctena quinquepunctata]